jgi:hypothetical protein
MEPNRKVDDHVSAHHLSLCFQLLLVLCFSHWFSIVFTYLFTNTWKFCGKFVGNLDEIKKKIQSFHGAVQSSE